MSGNKLSKALREFMRDEEEHGWVLVGRAGSGHYIAQHQATGAKVFLPSTPSDYRTLRNCRAKMRQLERTKMSHKE